MKISSFMFFAGTSVLASVAQQAPLFDENSRASEPAFYQFKRPIRRVAIIGAGVGYVFVRLLMAGGADSALFLSGVSSPTASSRTLALTYTSLNATTCPVETGTTPTRPPKMPRYPTATSPRETISLRCRRRTLRSHMSRSIAM